MPPRSKPPVDQSWVSLTDDDLLKVRICDLNVSIGGSALEEPLQLMFNDLDSKNLKFKPQIYLGDEWFSPDGIPAISVPFYLAHPRLKELEKNLMFEVEGGTVEHCLKLLRHEAGHCFDHAYGFSKRRSWRDLFGSPSQEYKPENYRPRPYSKSFVRHLDNWYAQAHPDEDFAETFAVWLSPHIDWRKEYAGWSVALRKLEYIDFLAQQVKNKNLQAIDEPLPYAAHRMRMTLEKYYQRRKKENAEHYPDFYDSDLRRIFDGEAALSRKNHGAALFMNQHRKQIIESVSFWTGERKYTINALVRKLALRCEKLDLKVSGDAGRINFEVAAYLATLVAHYQFTGKFKRSV